MSKRTKLLTEAKNYVRSNKEIAALEDFANRTCGRQHQTGPVSAQAVGKMERLDKPKAGTKSAHMTFHSDKTSREMSS